MSAAKTCAIHGDWVDDGTTDDCPECIADRLVEEFSSRAENQAEALEVERHQERKHAARCDEEWPA